VLERMLAVADDHPLAAEENVSVEELAHYAVPHWEFGETAARVREASLRRSALTR
jgi:hypothetical protein